MERDKRLPRWGHQEPRLGRASGGSRRSINRSPSLLPQPDPPPSTPHPPSSPTQPGAAEPVLFVFCTCVCLPSFLSSSSVNELTEPGLEGNE